MKKYLCGLRYILFLIFLSVFHVMISVAQTDETDRRTILQQLLNNIGKTVTTDKLIRELNSITKKYTSNAYHSGIEMAEVLAIREIEDNARRGYVDKMLVPYIKDKLKAEEQLLDAKQKASRVAELEKELEMYIPETNIHRRSQLQLFVGYSYDDVIAECRRLESAEETVKKELEQAKAAHTVQEERNNVLLGHIQTIADTIPLIKNAK